MIWLSRSGGRAFCAALLSGLVLAGAGRASAEPSVEDTEKVYRLLNALGAALADARRLLTSPSSATAAGSIDAAQDELRSAARHVCRALYRAKLLAAREALAAKRDASALEHLLGAEEILHECAEDPSAPSEPPDEAEPHPIRVVSQR